MTEDKDQNEESVVITEEEDRLNKWRIFGGSMTLLWVLTVLAIVVFDGSCGTSGPDGELRYLSGYRDPVVSHPCYTDLRELVPANSIHPDFTRVVDLDPDDELHPMLPTRYRVGPIWIYDLNCHVLGPGPSGLVFQSMDAWRNFESDWSVAADGSKDWRMRKYPMGDPAP